MVAKSQFISKKILPETDVLLQKCKIKIWEIDSRFGKQKRTVADYKILHEALRLYYAYLLGLIPEDVVLGALEKLSEIESRE